MFPNVWYRRVICDHWFSSSFYWGTWFYLFLIAQEPVGAAPPPPPPTAAAAAQPLDLWGPIPEGGVPGLSTSTGAAAAPCAAAARQDPKDSLQ
jgi:hypothetical protein